MKSEPDTFGIDDLQQRPQQTEPWDGVRNYQARNMMRDEMQVGDQVFFYHSNCAEPGIVGIAQVVKAGYPDVTALDPESKYFDPKASRDNPRWFRVDVKFVKKFRRTISLSELKQQPQLEGMAVLARGSRLSITPVTEQQWKF
ncbi:MAG TPA: EVE domain-containing protein, partial [Pseudomonadales bacterium]|nr:EVE domain-containing protein [Pseudomonadales bacterium]